LTRRRLSLALLLMFGFMLNPDADALAASGMAHMAQAQPAARRAGGKSAGTCRSADGRRGADRQCREPDRHRQRYAQQRDGEA
jgi:hypothetical protein